MTIFLSLMCAFFALSFSFESVVFCICLTAISSIAITIYAYYSTTDWGIIKALLMVIIGQSGGFILMQVSSKVVKVLPLYSPILTLFINKISPNLTFVSE